jgi:hypothetical protein
MSLPIYPWVLGVAQQAQSAQDLEPVEPDESGGSRCSIPLDAWSLEPLLGMFGLGTFVAAKARIVIPCGLLVYKESSCSHILYKLSSVKNPSQSALPSAPPY